MFKGQLAHVTVSRHGVSTIVRFVKDSAGYQGTYYKVSLDNKQRIHPAFSPSSVADILLSAIHREEP